MRRGLLKNAATLAPDPEREIDLGPAEELLGSGRAVVDLHGEQVLVLRIRADVFAVRNACPHLGLGLESCEIRRGRLRCGAHGREYDLHSGLERGRRGSGLLRYPVRVADGRLLLTPRER